MTEGPLSDPAPRRSALLLSPVRTENNREVLADEEAFSKRARAGELQLKVLITSAGDEQYRGDDPKLLAEAQRGSRMVDNASELAARLAALNPQRITVVRTIFDDEVHVTAGPASLSRGVRFALSRTAVSLAPEVLARYTGVYQVTPTSMITVEQTSGGLTVQPTGGRAIPFFAESETEFFLDKDFDVQITFERDSAGTSTGLLLHDGMNQVSAGGNFSAKKVK